MNVRIHEITDPVRYTKYLRILKRAFRHVRHYYQSQGKEEAASEALSMALYAKKFLGTIRALRLKYLYSPSYIMRPAVDLNVSGFPHYYNIGQLNADLSTREERLKHLPPIPELKLDMVEYVMTGDVESVKFKEKLNSYRWQISERAYLEALDLRAQFFQFTPGKLIPIEPSEENLPESPRRSYMFSWGCYDPDTNGPHVYLMVLEQDESEVPLDAQGNPEYAKFLDTVQHISARATTNLTTVAVQLDESFRTLYPKALKRLCVGPLASPILYKNMGAISPESFPARMIPIFERADVGEDDYVLCFRAEYVASYREEKARSMLPIFTGSSKARQVFHVPRNDRELLKRGAGAVVSYALMPHQLRQHLFSEDLSSVPELGRAVYLVYQKNEGDIIDVS